MKTQSTNAMIERKTQRAFNPTKTMTIQQYFASLCVTPAQVKLNVTSDEFKLMRRTLRKTFVHQHMHRWYATNDVVKTLRENFEHIFLRIENAGVKRQRKTPAQAIVPTPAQDDTNVS